MFCSFNIRVLEFFVARGNGRIVPRRTKPEQKKSAHRTRNLHNTRRHEFINQFRCVIQQVEGPKRTPLLFFGNATANAYKSTYTNNNNFISFSLLKLRMLKGKHPHALGKTGGAEKDIWPVEEKGLRRIGPWKVVKSDWWIFSLHLHLPSSPRCARISRRVKLCEWWKVASCWRIQKILYRGKLSEGSNNYCNVFSSNSVQQNGA